MKGADDRLSLDNSSSESYCLPSLVDRDLCSISIQMEIASYVTKTYDS